MSTYPGVMLPVLPVRSLTEGFTRVQVQNQSLYGVLGSQREETPIFEPGACPLYGIHSGAAH